MKTISPKFMVLIFLSNFMFLTILAQEKIEIDQRLEKGYQMEYLQNLQKNSPSTLILLNYNLDNSWFIASDEISSKIESMEYLYYKDPLTQNNTDRKVQFLDESNINIAEFYYEREHNTHKFYKVGDTGIIIGFYSALENAKNFNNHKKQ